VRLRGGRLLARGTNGIRKIVAGLRPFNESVWPGVRNDLFVAHESIYDFFGCFADGRDVFDGGCGTGYGSARLAAAGARSVLGVDLDPSSIRYARRHYASDRVTFQIGDLECLSLADSSIDLAVASNSLEHLDHPERFLESLARYLRPGGVAILAVPPIYTGADLATHASIHYHRSNLTVEEWLSRIRDAGFQVACYAHRAAANRNPDFSSPFRSRLQVTDFVFTPTNACELRSTPSITAVFVAKRLGGKDVLVLERGTETTPDQP
jgi:SAM-dependent methyltransferase